MKDAKEIKGPFTEKEIENLLDYFSVLRGVVKRLLGEGYKIKEGKLIPPPGYNPLNPDNSKGQSDKEC